MRDVTDVLGAVQLDFSDFSVLQSHIINRLDRAINALRDADSIASASTSAKIKPWAIAWIRNELPEQVDFIGTIGSSILQDKLQDLIQRLDKQAFDWNNNVTEALEIIRGEVEKIEVPDVAEKMVVIHFKTNDGKHKGTIRVSQDASVEKAEELLAKKLRVPQDKIDPSSRSYGRELGGCYGLKPLASEWEEMKRDPHTYYIRLHNID